MFLMKTRSSGIKITKPAEVRIYEKLKSSGRELSLAESCTGGLAAHRITNVPGSSSYFAGGIIAYSNDVKTGLLGVAPSVLKKNGAVSRETALAMARGVRKGMGTDLGAAITGIAGPGGGTSSKPVGLAYIAFSSPGKQKYRKLSFKGGRVSLKIQFSQALLEFILSSL